MLSLSINASTIPIKKETLPDLWIWSCWTGCLDIAKPTERLRDGDWNLLGFLTFNNVHSCYLFLTFLLLITLYIFFILRHMYSYISILYKTGPAINKDASTWPWPLWKEATEKKKYWYMLSLCSPVLKSSKFLLTTLLIVMVDICCQVNRPELEKIYFVVY